MSIALVSAKFVERHTLAPVASNLSIVVDIDDACYVLTLHLNGANHRGCQSDHYENTEDLLHCAVPPVDFVFRPVCSETTPIS